MKFYCRPSPSPATVALFLEEAGSPYELVPVDTRKGERHAPERNEYAVNRYLYEAKRHYGILDARPAQQPYMLDQH